MERMQFAAAAGAQHRGDLKQFHEAGAHFNIFQPFHALWLWEVNRDIQDTADHHDIVGIHNVDPPYPPMSYVILRKIGWPYDTYILLEIE